MRAGYIGTESSPSQIDDPVNPLSSSATYYPHVLQLDEDTLAFLPVQPGEQPPISYSGISYFGSLTSECVPANLNGSIGMFLAARTVDEASRNEVRVQGFLDVPFPGAQTPQHINHSRFGFIQGLPSGSDLAPVMAAWSLETWNAEPGIQYIALVLVTNLTQTISSTVYGTGDRVASSGFFISSGPKPGYSVQVCRLELPSQFGLIDAPHISRTPSPFSDPRLPFQGGPNITVYDAGPEAQTHPWSPTEALAAVNASYTDFRTVKQSFSAFSNPGGLAFCTHCIVTANAVARSLSPYVASAAASLPVNVSNTALAAALRTVALHAIAFTYRSELPSFNGRGNATYVLLQPATVIVNPNWVYGATAYVFALILAAVGMRYFTLKQVGGVDRAGSTLSGAALLAAPSPFAGLVREGDCVDAGELEERVEKGVKRQRVAMRGVEGEWRIRAVEQTGRKSGVDGIREAEEAMVAKRMGDHLESRNQDSNAMGELADESSAGTPRIPTLSQDRIRRADGFERLSLGETIELDLQSLYSRK